MDTRKQKFPTLTGFSKILIVALIGCLLFCLASLFTSCSDQPMQSNSPTNTTTSQFSEAIPVTGTAYILFDYTEGQEYNVDLGKVLMVVDRSTVNKISIQPIRDLSYSDHTDIMLSGGEDHSGNAMVKRKKAAKALANANLEFQAVQSLLNEQYTGQELPKSAIVNPVADVLSKAGSNDYVIIFSDLIENNNDGINFRRYNQEQITEYWQNNCQANNTHVVAVTKAFRQKDDKYMRTCIKGLQSYCADNMISFTQTTNL